LQLELLLCKLYNQTIENMQVTVQKADQVFEHLQVYKVLVCKTYCYAVQNLDDHLK